MGMAQLKLKALSGRRIKKNQRETESFRMLGANSSQLQHCGFSAFVWPIDLPGE